MPFQWGKWRYSQSIFNGTQYVTPDSKIYCEKGKMCRCSSLEIGFSAPNSCSLPRLVKGPTQLCTSQKECNELLQTGAQYWSMRVIWSRWFAISSPPCICSSSFSFIGGVVKRKTAKLKHLVLLPRVTYRAQLKMLLVSPIYEGTKMQTQIIILSFNGEDCKTMRPKNPGHHTILPRCKDICQLLFLKLYLETCHELLGFKAHENIKWFGIHLCVF